MEHNHKRDLWSSNYVLYVSSHSELSLFDIRIDLLFDFHLRLLILLKEERDKANIKTNIYDVSLVMVLLLVGLEYINSR